ADGPGSVVARRSTFRSTPDERISTSKTEDATVVLALRRRKLPRESRESFMKPAQVRQLRKDVLRATQGALAAQLDSPDTGRPVSMSAICRWERGTLPVPLWAARRIRKLAE